jgi:hypothetical protein
MKIPPTELNIINCLSTFKTIRIQSAPKTGFLLKRNQDKLSPDVAFTFSTTAQKNSIQKLNISSSSEFNKIPMHSVAKRIPSRRSDSITLPNDNKAENLFSLKYFFISSIYFYRSLDIYYKESFYLQMKNFAFLLIFLFVIVELKCNKEAIL